MMRWLLRSSGGLVVRMVCVAPMLGVDISCWTIAIHIVIWPLVRLVVATLLSAHGRKLAMLGAGRYPSRTLEAIYHHMEA